jgi:hypothetical protein
MIKELSVIVIPLILIAVAVEQLKNPAANEQYIPTETNSTVRISLTGNEIKNRPLNFSIIGPPSHGNLSATASIVWFIFYEPNLFVLFPFGIGVFGGWFNQSLYVNISIYAMKRRNTE